MALTLGPAYRFLPRVPWTIIPETGTTKRVDQDDHPKEGPSAWLRKRPGCYCPLHAPGSSITLQRELPVVNRRVLGL